MQASEGGNVYTGTAGVALALAAVDPARAAALLADAPPAKARALLIACGEEWDPS